MPYEKSNPPDRIKSLPKHAQSIWISAFNSAIKDNDEESANRIAWASVKKKYKKDSQGNWVKKASEMKFTEWTTAYVNDLPDSAFAWIESGGEKDDEGKTKPRSLRHLPYKNQDGGVDLPHLRNALARLSQVKGLSSSKEESIRNKLEGILEKKRSSDKLEYTLLMDEDVTGETSEIQIMPTGDWDHPSYGEINIAEGDIEEFVKHEDLRNDIPITAGHAKPGEEKPAIGWFKELINKGKDGLWGVVEWTQKGEELLKDQAFKYFSPEFHTKYEDPETREVYDNVLVGGALTNIPYFKGLKGVALSEVFCNQEFNMDEEKKEDLPEDEKVEDEEEEKVEADEEEEEIEIEVEEESEAVEASENTVKIEASEYQTLTRKADEGHKAMQELREKRLDEFVKSWQFSEKNEDGVFLPKSEDKVREFAESLNKKQLMKFEEILSDVPTKNIFDEEGDEGEEDTEKAKAKKLDEIADKKADEEDISYSDAVKIITRENPELSE